MDFGLFHSVFSVMIFLIFLGIAVWAWMPRQQDQFKDAKQSIFSDNELKEMDNSNHNGDVNHE